MDRWTKSQDDHYEELAERIYGLMPWEGETYEAVAEHIAADLINEGWKK